MDGNEVGIWWSAIAATAAALSALVSLWQLRKRGLRDKQEDARRRAERGFEHRREQAIRDLDILWALQDALQRLPACVEEVVRESTTPDQIRRRLTRCSEAVLTRARRTRHEDIRAAAVNAANRCAAGVVVESTEQWAEFVRECSDLSSDVDALIEDRARELEPVAAGVEDTPGDPGVED